MKHLFLATIAGAFVALMWGYVSWEMLSWHDVNEFSNGDEVSEVILKNVDSHSIYQHPAPGESGINTEAVTKGPFIYAIVRPEPLSSPWSMKASLIRFFCMQLLGALIISMAVLHIRKERYIYRAGVGCMMGGFAGLMTSLPAWNWLELPAQHTVAYLLDPLLTWTLGGLVIAAIIRPKRPRRLFS